MRVLSGVVVVWVVLQGSKHDTKLVDCVCLSPADHTPPLLMLATVLRCECTLRIHAKVVQRDRATLRCRPSSHRGKCYGVCVCVCVCVSACVNFCAFRRVAPSFIRALASSSPRRERRLR
jgi:hypothetical protein